MELCRVMRWVSCQRVSHILFSAQDYQHGIIQKCFGGQTGGQDVCQKGGVAYPRLPYLRQGEPNLFDVRVQLVIKPKVTTNG